MAEADSFRHRLVVLGANKVGKTAIIKRFLNLGFLEKYIETVEDLYCREYKVDGSSVKVDILDTAGNNEFPAMRRLSISTGHAFVLVYAVDKLCSFEIVCGIYEQIKEIRSDIAALPLVIVGNKTDLACDRDVDEEDLELWIQQEDLDPKKFAECSAKDNRNVLDIFSKLMDQYQNPQMRKLSPALRRKMSAYAATRRRNRLNAAGATGENGDKNGGPPPAAAKSGSLKVSHKNDVANRSRSLIRRFSQKAHKPGFAKESQDLMDNDCCIS